MTENQATEEKLADLAAISVQSRLLPFWRAVPRAWFVQFEAVVDPLKTSDDQKYRYVLQKLEPIDLQHVTDILYDPPETGKYEAIKSRLLTVYEKSEVQNFQKLISGLELGDQKPSVLLRKMRELDNGLITEEGLKIEWLNHLSPQSRCVLSVNKESSLDTLAAMADQMMEYTGSTSTGTVAVVSTPAAPPTSSREPTNSEILAKLEKLTLEIAELRERGRPTHRMSRRFRNLRYRSRSRPASSSRRPREAGDNTRECWYHYKFGEKAKRCESPCARKNKSSEN
ncbi:uncharacterized protein LOC123876050 [Maniola jurtina]|uniref:uncharacterized protein LOC123876050 n=1 Tax=Maniola jurtina TaxID=191418 RepID=UPI001E68AAFB|nr:uncharacterized protein LOC123876050 [Maniola jurtina]